MASSNISRGNADPKTAPKAVGEASSSHGNGGIRLITVCEAGLIECLARSGMNPEQLFQKVPTQAAQHWVNGVTIDGHVRGGPQVRPEHLRELERRMKNSSSSGAGFKRKAKDTKKDIKETDAKMNE